MAYQLVSFDLDGTMVDTAAEIAEAANLALEAHGIAHHPIDEIARLIGAGTRELMGKLLDRCFAQQPQLLQTVQLAEVMASFDPF